MSNTTRKINEEIKKSSFKKNSMDGLELTETILELGIDVLEAIDN